MTLKTLEDLEALEQRVMQIAGQETEQLVETVCSPTMVLAALRDEGLMKQQAAYKKNTANTYLLCERILRYIAARKVLGKRNLEGLEELTKDVEQAQQRATAGVQKAKSKLHLVGGNGTRN